MPKTINDVGKRALRVLGVLAFGASAEANEASGYLDAFQGMFDHLAATQAFGPLTDVLTSGAYTAGENERITGAASVALPTTLVDERTGETRTPRDRAIVVVAGATPVTHIYDADLAAWVAIRDLTLISTAPLSSRFFDGLCAMLAVHLAPEYGVTPTPDLQNAARQGRFAVTRRANFRAADVALALTRTSNRMNYEVS